MTELLTAAQMRAVEQAAIASGSVTGLELMERAGAGVVEAVLAEWPELRVEPGRAVVLCGPGNNGGDGFVIARLLHERGWRVAVYLYGDAEKLPPDAKTNYVRWCELGDVLPYIDDGNSAFFLDPAEFTNGELLIDALFGTGLTRPVERFNSVGWVTQMSEWRLSTAPFGTSPNVRVVAVDIPSGLCADSGRILRSAVPPRDLETIRADLTVSFHSMKPGHLLAEGPQQCGKTVVADIGLPHLSSPELIAVADAPSFALGKSPNSHKYGYGHALILAGGSGKGGAARLAARAALRVGAGLVTVAPTPGALQENAAQLEAVMLAPVGDAAALEAVLADERKNALCLGPGLGQERARDLVPVALAMKRRIVLDADALTAFADDPAVLFAMLHKDCVLTPHDGEFARLFPDIVKHLCVPADKGPAYSKVDAVREAAVRAGCVVLLKGPDTVIAAPDGACRVHAAVYGRTAPWLATAGSGDVLAGLITGLLARKLSPLVAAEAAAWLHVEAARAFGPGLIAEDLPEMLPKVFRDLGL